MVLEARENAETVWYPVVWEETKDASNVIDYNINKEVTIDTTSMFNANNETTTWEATLVYWVNAPQILEKTSIHEIVNWQNNYSKSYSLVSTDLWDNDWHTYLRTPTIQEQWWQYLYSIWDYFNWYYFLSQRALIIPETWTYNVSCKYYSTVTVYNRKYEIRINDSKIKDLQNDWYYWQYWNAYPTEEFVISANKWDKLVAYVSLKYTAHLWPWEWVWTNWNITIQLTKL